MSDVAGLTALRDRLTQQIDEYTRSLEEAKSALAAREKEVKDLSSANIMKDSFIKLKDSMISAKDQAAKESLAKIGELEKTVFALRGDLETLKAAERANTLEINR